MFEAVLLEYQDDLAAVDEWVQSIWDATFTDSFAEASQLYSRLKNTDVKISDSDLERILTILPLDLFDAAEKLNNLRLTAETIKLKNKDRETMMLNKAHPDISAAEWKRFVDTDMTEFRLLSVAYGAIITRAENQITFCKELIMSAKKIYDGRRGGERANPVNEVDPHNGLPPYSPSKGNYIK